MILLRRIPFPFLLNDLNYPGNICVPRSDYYLRDGFDSVF